MGTSLDAGRHTLWRWDNSPTSRKSSPRMSSSSRHSASTGLGHDMRWSIHEGVIMPDSPNDRARAAWRTLTSRPVYANPWIRVREDTAELPDGRTTLYGVVECAPAVGVLPFLDARTVVLVGQWRYVARAFTWEMPTGAMQPGESAEAAVQRELGEEAGYAAARLVKLASIATAKSVMDETATCTSPKRCARRRASP